MSQVLYDIQLILSVADVVYFLWKRVVEPHSGGDVTHKTPFFCALIWKEDSARKFYKVSSSYLSLRSNTLDKTNGNRGLKKRQLLVMLLLTVLFVSATPLAKAATTLAAPTVSLPNSNWEKTDSTAYPDSFAEHDPAGAGMLEFTDKTNYDVVRIFYEKAQVTSYTTSQLKTEAEDLFNEIDLSDTRSLNDSGTKNFAGVVAGYAKGYDANEETYKTELVFIKGDYYFNVHAFYDATIQSEDNVNSIINSIDVSGASVESLTSFPWLLIIGVAAVVAVIIIVVVVLMTRKKKTAQPQQQKQYNNPPPTPQ